MFTGLVIIVLLLLAGLRVDAAILIGVIRANELSGPPMPMVGVVADGTNPTASDDFGRFTLEFPRKNPGDTVRIIVSKEGYVVVNDVQLQLALPADADAAPLTVILAKEADPRRDGAAFVILRVLREPPKGRLRPRAKLKAWRRAFHF